MAESYCGECATGKLGCKDCCTDPFVGKDPGFWMTLSDVSRIVNNAKINPDEFCRFTTVDEDDLEEEDDIDEKHDELMSYNDKVILMNSNGRKKCFFLGKNGCNVFDSRPKMCRIFPFWFKEKEDDVQITIQHEEKFEEEECMVSKVHYGSQDIPYLLKCIGETEEGMKNCIKEYLKEMEFHSKFKHELERKSILQILKDNGFVDKNIKTDSTNKP